MAYLNELVRLGLSFDNICKKRSSRRNPCNAVYMSVDNKGISGSFSKIDGYLSHVSKWLTLYFLNSWKMLYFGEDLS